MADGSMPGPKRLVVCCDGTWNTPEMDSPTNVVRLAGNVLPRSGDGVLQLLFYDAGVGTGGWMDRLVGGAFGEGLDTNVREAYRFIANNCAAGDEIYLFGFSRGAYSVRSVAGMIGYAGLLGRDQMTLVGQAYELYRNGKSADGHAAKEFRARHGTNVPPITLLGCWDTVGALGIPDKLPGIPLDQAFADRYRWLDFNLGKHVQAALHAVAIDERRKEFGHTPMCSGSPGQVLHEVWFPGDHGCVGGGTEHKEPLSRAALEWMVEQIRELGLGLAIDTDFKRLRIADHNTYFNGDRKLIYGKGLRRPDADSVVHESAIRRYHDLAHYRESLDDSQRTFLETAALGGTGTLSLAPKGGLTLGIGATAHAIVHAREHRNDTGIDLVDGARYRLSAASSQCWQDGDLPPCNASGWRLDDPAVQRALGRFGKLTQRVIDAAQGSRVVPDADWFQLVAAVRNAEGDEHKWPIGLEAEFEAPFDGRLMTLANDLESRMPLMDRYGNNEGWVVVEVSRLA